MGSLERAWLSLNMVYFSSLKLIVKEQNKRSNCERKTSTLYRHFHLLYLDISAILDTYMWSEIYVSKRLASIFFATVVYPYVGCFPQS